VQELQLQLNHFSVEELQLRFQILDLYSEQEQNQQLNKNQLKHQNLFLVELLKQMTLPNLLAHFLADNKLRQVNRKPVVHYLEVPKQMAPNQPEALFLEESRLLQGLHSSEEYRTLLKYLVVMLNLQLHCLLQLQAVVFLARQQEAVLVTAVDLSSEMAKHLINQLDHFLVKPTICFLNLLMAQSLLLHQTTAKVNLRKTKTMSQLMSLLPLPLLAILLPKPKAPLVN
jgi:hypothetical protein